MKLIGITGDDSVVDQEYYGGSIIQLTRDETIVLSRLQEATDGFIDSGCANFSMRGLKDRNMDNVFYIIYAWSKMKFSFNEIKYQINRAEELLTKEDEGI